MEKHFEHLDCSRCDAKCCRYIALEIDKPTCKRDYDQIRWYLRHKDVHVFVDHEGDWCIEFKANCDALGTDNRCAKYDDRPNVCKEHGRGKECDYYHEEHAPYVENFNSSEEFETYLEGRGIAWKYAKRT